MSIVFIANLISMAGAVLMVAIGFLKSKQRILAVQCVQFGVMALGNLLLGGFTGFISNLVSIFRNLVCARREFTVKWKLLFIAVQLLLAVSVNKQGALGLLPILAACIFTWFLDIKSNVGFKLVIISTSVMWLVYDYAIQNYVSFVFDILTICSNLAGICLLIRSAPKKQTISAENVPVTSL